MVRIREIKPGTSLIVNRQYLLFLSGARCPTCVSWKGGRSPHLVAAESEPQAYQKVLANSQGLIVTVVSLRYCCPHGPLPPLENMDDVYASCSVASNSLQPFGCSQPGFLVHGISQARILEWVAISSFRGSSQLRDRTQVSYVCLHCRQTLYLLSHGGSPYIIYRGSVVAKTCPTLCNPTDCRLPGFLVHGISQTRILEWVAISFLSESSQLRDRTQVSYVCLHCRQTLPA